MASKNRPGGKPHDEEHHTVVSVGKGPETRRDVEEITEEGEFIAEEPLEERFKGPQDENA